MRVIENTRLRVEVDERYGGRVVSLLDKRTTREWMTQGATSPNVGEAARYGEAEAVGWDECFPTVGPWDGSATVWGRQLRDHGDLWGRGWQVDGEGLERLALMFTGAEYRFRRELSLSGDKLTAAYQVENLLDRPLPYLWALHALLAVRAGDRIELPGVGRVRASYLSASVAQELDWPSGSGVVPFPLDEVQPASAGFAAKLIASGAEGLARVVGAHSSLELRWDPEAIGHLGLWFTYGAWFGHQEIAIEPTNAPADHLGQAIEAGAPPLAPGERREWQVSMRVGP